MNTTTTDTTRQRTGDNPRLRKHTIRTLSSHELNAVAGGTTGSGNTEAQ